MKKLKKTLCESVGILWAWILMDSILSLSFMIFSFCYPGSLKSFPKVFSHFSMLCMDIGFWSDVKTIPWFVTWLAIAFSVLIFKFVLVGLAKRKKKFTGIGTAVIYSIDLIAYLYNCVTFIADSDSILKSFLLPMSLYFIVFPLVISFFYMKNYQSIETTKFIYPKKVFLKDLKWLLLLFLFMEYVAGLFCAFDIFSKTQKVLLTTALQPIACLLVNNYKQTTNTIYLILALGVLLITLLFIILLVKKVKFAGIALAIIHSLNLIGALYINVNFLLTGVSIWFGIFKLILTLIIYGAMVLLCVKRFQILKRDSRQSENC